MTIHHDKLAYGKLASSSEDVSEKRIEEMLKQLAENKEKDEKSDKKEGPADKGC